jgi:hypothetical protein
MRTRSYITILAAMMIDSALFGTGIVIVLSTPALREYAAFLIPLVLAASFGSGTPHRMETRACGAR